MSQKDDLISRQSVIDALMSNESLMGVPWWDENGDQIDDMDERREIIAAWLSRVLPIKLEPCDSCKHEDEDCWEMCQYCPAERR